MNAWTIYLLLKLDVLLGVAKAFTILAGGCCAASTIVLIASIVDNWYPKYKKVYKKIIIPSILTFLLAGTIATLAPSTKQMCAIYLIPKIANNEKIQNIGDKSLTLIEQKFEEWVDDITKKIS